MPKRNLSEDFCLQESKKYSSVSEFISKDKAVYNKLCKMGWLNEGCSHMTTSRKQWSKEDCRKAALACKTRNEFKRYYPKQYAHSLSRGFIDDVCGHMELQSRPRTKEECLNAALKYSSRSEFRKSEPDNYNYARHKGWLDEICGHMVHLKQKWTYEDCRLEALKYTHRAEFYHKSLRQYSFAASHGWLDEICSHMVLKNIKRTKDDCHEVALKYKYRSEFEKGDVNTYNYAVRFGWIDEVCSHMPKAKRGFNPNKVGYVYYLIFGDYVGFGITNLLDDRIKRHRTALGRCGYIMDNLSVIQFDKGKDAATLETKIKKEMDIVDSMVKGFRREALNICDFQSLVKFIETYVTNLENSVFRMVEDKSDCESTKIDSSPR